MRKISTLVTILITSFVMALFGLAASSVATASENETVTSSFSFPTGSSVLTKSQKAAIKKVVATAGKDATFLVTGEAGKFPGVSDNAVQALAKKRGQVVKAYLVKLGVSKSSVTTKVKITRLGIVPKTKIVGSYARPTPTPTTVPTTSVALTCATGGTCIVGDRGPGGGIVYYVSPSPFTSAGSNCNTACKYLEVAPATWQSALGNVGPDETYIWSDSVLETTQNKTLSGMSESGNTDERVNWKIGQGFNNTSVMKVSTATSPAQTAVLAYAGSNPSNLGQWFIPSVNELNELCKYARGQITGVLTVPCDGTETLKSGTSNDLGGFVENFYWSSSEFYLDTASGQSLSVGGLGLGMKFDGAFVRPVRAF